MDTLTRRPLLWITVLAALLRLPTLAVESLWYDETFTAWLANLPLQNLVNAARGDVHPPTWYLIEWGIVTALGSHAFSLRLISALAGIALIPAVWRLSGILAPSRRVSAALITAIAPFAVYYSQEARAYSLLMLVLTVALIALLEQKWLWFVACAVFALYLHNLAALSLAAVAWVGLYRFWRKPALYAAFAAIGLAWLPWLIFGFLPQAQAVQTAFWVRPPSLGSPVFILTALFWSEKAILLVFVTVPLLVLGLYQAAAGGVESPKELTALLLIPIALGVILSVLIAPVLVPRIVAFSAIPLYLLLGPPPGPARRWPAVAAAPIAVLIAFYGLYWYTDRIGRYPWDFGLPPNVVKASDGVYHANLATYIVYHYYMSNEQFVWRQANDLSQSLTDQTKAAMQMRQAQFDDVACRHDRWLVTFYENPTTNDAERAEIARIVQKYQGVEAAAILKNDLANARLYVLDNVCHQQAGLK